MHTIVIYRDKTIKKVFVDDIISIKYCDDVIIEIMVCCNDDIEIIKCDVDDVIHIWLEYPIDCKIMIDYRSDFISFVDYIKLDMTKYNIYFSSSRAGCTYKYIDKIIII